MHVETPDAVEVMWRERHTPVEPDPYADATGCGFSRMTRPGCLVKLASVGCPPTARHAATTESALRRVVLNWLGESEHMSASRRRHPRIVAGPCCARLAEVVATSKGVGAIASWPPSSRCERGAISSPIRTTPSPSSSPPHRIRRGRGSPACSGPSAGRNLYVVLDIFSRYVVGWMVAERETTGNAALRPRRTRNPKAQLTTPLCPGGPPRRFSKRPNDYRRKQEEIGKAWPGVSMSLTFRLAEAGRFEAEFSACVAALARHRR